MSLTLILPTRGRPGLLSETIRRTLENVREPSTRIAVFADDDDSATLASSRVTDPRVLWFVAPRPDAVAWKHNQGPRVLPADVYMNLPDYAPIVTPGFDTIILERAKTYPDGYCFLVNNLDNLSTSQLHGMTHKLYETMGHFWPEYFPYWFVDHWFEEIARRVGRLVYCDVWIDTSKRPGTMGKREPYFWGLYFGCLEEERRAIADKILDAPDFDETPARKRALRANYPLSVQWSGTINALLRKDFGIPVDPADVGYARLRRRASEVVTERAPEGALTPPPSLFVATPMYGGQCYGAYTDSMMKLQHLCGLRGVPLRFFPIFNQSHIDTARNVCADEFLKSGFTHFLFVDSDISFGPEAVFDLLAADRPIVCAMYPKKRINWKLIVQAVKKGYADKDPELLQHFVGDMVFTPALNDDSNRTRSIYDLTLLHEGGTGFMMVKREVFETLCAPWYWAEGPNTRKMSSFFDARIENTPYRRHLTEDYGFCALAREAGYEIWLAPWIKLTHHGYYQFVGNIEALAAVTVPKEEKAA